MHFRKLAIRPDANCCFFRVFRATTGPSPAQISLKGHIYAIGSSNIQ